MPVDDTQEDETTKFGSTGRKIDKAKDIRRESRASSTKLLSREKKTFENKSFSFQQPK